VLNTWKLTLTVQATRDGSSVRSLIEMDPASVDTNTDGANAPVKAPCPYAGKSIFLTRNDDESVTNDFQGNASDSDSTLLNGIITPDEAWFPDKPVAVGEKWDTSAKFGKFLTLDATDKITYVGCVDWVKTVGGKQIAQITSLVTESISEAGNVTENMKYTSVLLVDISLGRIIRFDCKGSSQYITLNTEPTQVTGGTTFFFHAKTLPETTAVPSTQP
jgi:hypothetical protein